MNRLRTHALPIARFHDALGSALDALPDGELLDRFAQYADHPAFESLLRRHGVMVYGVCRRILENADADDAFQATFLILIRKARSIRGGPLGPWLYGVACRVAMKARARAARFAEFRAEAAEMIPDPTTPVEIPDWLPLLDAELAALPAKYRDALVLCELQGASRAEAAKTLGVREGTLSSRLARGRELLRKRLLKHGTLLPTGGLAALLIANGISRATVPAALQSKTSELAKAVTGAAAGAVPVGAARLTDEVLKSMFLTKLRVAGTAGLAVLLAVGVTTAAWPSDSSGAPPAENGVTKRMATPNPPGEVLPFLGAKSADRGAIQDDKGTVLPDREAFQGLWVLEKMDSGKDVVQAGSVPAGKTQLLVAGDAWWRLAFDSDGASPMSVKFDPTKNPKWIDMGGLSDANEMSQCIYELDGDKLRVCINNVGNTRPAEFTTDPGSPLVVLTFGRGKMPQPAGEKALVGSWEGSRESMGAGQDLRVATRRVEILDGYLFAYSNEHGRNGEWLGGKYTVDATKNPKWIDVELAGPLDDGKITKLYGCFEAADGRLKLALGPKRATRPLEFKDAPDAVFFDLKATKEPLRPFEKGDKIPKTRVPVSPVPVDRIPAPSVPAAPDSSPRVPVSPVPTVPVPVDRTPAPTVPTPVPSVP